jgi:segregation and condensation protein A
LSYKVRLDIFEGPLDLLLYLIKKEELDIYNIPITKITEQYLEQLALMETLDLEIAGEFLVMAATLMQIKSRMLLPPDPEGVETEQEDPRAELVRRLLEYKAFKEASERLRGFESRRGGMFTRLNVEPEIDSGDSPLVEVSIFDLLSALAKVLKTLPKEAAHEIGKDEFSVAEKVHEIYHRLLKDPVIRLGELFRSAKNKFEAITTFLAVLELIRQKEIAVAQDTHFGEIEVRRNAAKTQPPTAASEGNAQT